MRLNKSIINKLNCDTSNGFYYYGIIDGYEIYRIISTHGGKRGNPKYFAIDTKERIEWIRGLERINSIRLFNPEPQLISLTHLS